jgi:hypothetical protein
LPGKEATLILPGRLSTTTLGDLLGVCFRAHISGILELTEDAGPVAGRAHRLRFDAGLIQGIESPLGAPPLGELLVNVGSLTRHQHFELLLRLQGMPDKSTGQWLAEFHWVEPDTLRRVVQQQLSDRLTALFTLPDARVAYRIGRTLAHRAVEAQPLPPEIFLHGRPRSRDRNAKPPATSARQCPHHDLGLRDSARVHALLSLGLTPQSGTGDVKKAFHRMVSRLHPDRHVSAPPSQQDAARRRFVQIVNAYNTLMDLDTAHCA